MSFHYLAFDEWFATLPVDAQERTRTLIEQFRRLGAADPESSARSEVSENIPQLARFLVLKRVRDQLERWTNSGELDKTAHYDEHFENLLTALRAAGLRDEVIAKFAQKVAAITAMDVVYVIDEGHDPNGPRDTPTWSLEEGNANGEPTNRGVGGLHESFSEFDPTRIEHKH